LEYYNEIDKLIEKAIKKYRPIYPASTSIQSRRLDFKSREVILEYNSVILKDKIRIVIEYYLDKVFKQPNKVVFYFKIKENNKEKVIEYKRETTYPVKPIVVEDIIEHCLERLEDKLIYEENKIIEKEIVKQFEEIGLPVDYIEIRDPSEIDVGIHLYEDDYINFRGYIDYNGKFVIEKVEIECVEETTKDIALKKIIPKLVEIITIFKLLA